MSSEDANRGNHPVRQVSDRVVLLVVASFAAAFVLFGFLVDTPAGPGTIAASIALGAQIPTTPVQYVAGAAVAAAGAALVALVLYFIFRHAAAVLEKLGEVGTLVMIRLMAFMLLCIGIQIMWTGWAELNGMTP